MKQTKIHVGMLITAFLSISVLVVAPVSAQNGTDDPVPTTTQSDDVTTSNDDTTEAEVHKGNRTERVNQIKLDAQKHVAELKTGKKAQTAEKRQKMCEGRAKAVNNKVKAFSNAAQKHLDRLDGVFTKLQAYQTANNVNVDNYDSLVATATTNQTAATEAVAALKTVAVGIDCTSTDPASSLSVVKASAADARNALKTYRKSLKDIVVAFAHAKGADDTTNTTEGAE